MFVIPSEFSASGRDLSTFKNKQLGVFSPILFFFRLLNVRYSQILSKLTLPREVFALLLLFSVSFALHPWDLPCCGLVFCLLTCKTDA